MTDDDSEDEPLLIPVPEATTEPRDAAAHIAATHNIINRRALEQHQRRKLRRESANRTGCLGSGYDQVEPIKVEPEEATAHTEQESEELRDHLSSASASDRSQAQTVEPELADHRVSLLPLDQKEDARHTTRKAASSLTPIKVRGKRSDRPADERSSARLEAERERSRREEREYEAAIDANLRRAREEAERQTSASKLERAERFVRSLVAPAAADFASETAPDSSPTLRVAEKRQVRTLVPMPVPVPQLSGSRSACHDDPDIPSSPPVLGESYAAKRRVHFDQGTDGDDNGHRLDRDNGSRPRPRQEACFDSPGAWTDEVDGLLRHYIPDIAPGAAREPAPSPSSCSSEATRSRTEKNNTSAPPVQQMAAAASLPQRHLASSRPPRRGSPRDIIKQSLAHWARGRYQSRRVADRVSKSYGTNRKPAKKKSTSRKPGF